MTSNSLKRITNRPMTPITITRKIIMTHIISNDRKNLDDLGDCHLGVDNLLAP